MPLNIFNSQQKNNTTQQSQEERNRQARIDAQNRLNEQARQAALNNARYYTQQKNEALKEKYNAYTALQRDPGSKYYNPYSQPTNKSVSALSAYGIDTSNINDDWYNRNSFLTQYLHYDGTTNTPSKPGKKASDAEKAAYEYYQIWKSEEATKKAEEQWKALQKELTYWTQRSDRNYSDEEILGQIDWSKYGELESMRKNAQFQPNEYNRAIGYSQDAIQATIWAARNGGGTGNTALDYLYSLDGAGNQYKYNPEIAAKLDPTNPNYNPYSLGSTDLDSAAAYFGVSSFDSDWCSKHTYLLNGSDEDKKYYQMVYNAEQTTQAAEKAVETLNAWMSTRDWTDTATAQKELDDMLAAGKIYVKDGKFSLRKRDKWDVVDLSVLNKLDQSMGKGDNPPTGDLLATTRGVNYKYADILNEAEAICANNAAIGDGFGFINSTNDIINAGGATSAGSYDDLRQQADADRAAKLQADYERGQQVSKETEGKGPAIPTGGYDDLTNEQFAKYAATEQGRYYSQADLEQAKADDKKIREAANATEGIATEDETTVMQNAGSVTYGPVKDWMGQLLSRFNNPADPLAIASLGQMEHKYFDTAMDNSYMVGTYNKTEDRLAENEPVLSEFESVWGDIRGYMDAVKGEYGHDQQIEVGPGLNVEFAYDPETHTYTLDRFYSPGMADISDLDSEYDLTPDMIFASPEENGLGYDRESVMRTVDDKLTELNETAARAAVAEERYANASDEDKRMIDSMRNLAVQVDQDRKYLEDNRAEYEERSATLANSENNLRIVKTALGWLGGEDDKTDQTTAMLDYMSEFYDEPPLVCESETHSQKLRAFAANVDYELTGEELSSALQSGLDETNKEIDMINMSLEWADKNGYEIPDQVWKHMQQRLEDLEYERQGYEYEMILANTDPAKVEELSELGERLCRKRDAIINSFPNATYQTADLTYASAEEQELYYYLIGKRIADSGADIDAILDQRNYNTPTMLHSAIDRFMTDADKYADYMSNDDHGIWTGRRYDYLQEDAREMVDSGFWGGALANVGSTALTPIESIASMFYLLDKAVTGGRINPKSGSRNITAFKESTREATFESIDEVYKDNPIAKKLARLGFEIYSNRGDSVMNALAFGWMIPGEGILANIGGAVPMGGTAALTAAAHAIERGASTEQAWLIAGATFVAETVTEGVTYSNIREALGTAKNISKDTIKAFFKDWLTKEGVEEMIGESINDLIENAADMFVMQDASDHQELVNKYLAQNYSEEEAQWMARQEELKSVMHTALVSYLSPGSDVFMKVGKAAANTAGYYRSASQYYQQNGQDVSMWELMLDDWRGRKYGVNEADTSTSMDQVAEKEQAVNPQYQTEQAQTAASEEELPAYARKAKADYERGNAAKEASEKEAGISVPETTPSQRQTAKEVVAIDQSKDADKSTKAAVLATVLSTKSKNGTDFKADAAAAFVGRAFGPNAEQTVQEALIGAENAGINTRDVKTAIKNAALGEGAATAMVQSEAFQNATPEEKARMLVSTIPQDAQDKQVSRNINARITDFRRGRIYGELATQGHFDQAKADQQAATDTAKATSEAQGQLEEKQNALDSAIENQQTINQQFQENPSTDNLKQQQDAITKVDNADESRKQYEQHLQKQQDAQAKAEEQAEKTTADAMNSARAIADQQIAQEDQVLAEKEAQVIEEERIAKEQEEAARVAEELNGNANEADIEAFIERQYPDATEEEKARVRQMVPQIAEQIRLEQQEAQTEQTAEQNAPQSNEPTMNYNPNFSEQENKTINRVFKKFNVPMMFTDTTETRNGNTIRSEGYYVPGKHQIVLDKNMSYEEVMTRVLPHELLHSMEKSGSYGNVVNTMFGYLYGKDANFTQAVENLKKNGGKATTRLEMDILAKKAEYDTRLGIDMSIEDAAHELAANRMGNLFYDPNNPQRSQDLVNRLVADQPSLARQVMNSIKSMLKKALGLKGAWVSNAQKTVDLFEQALAANRDAKTESATQTDKMAGMRKYELGNVNDITREDVYNLLENVLNGEMADGTYIPLRRNTPEILIEEVKKYTKGEKILRNSPIISEVGHMRQNMDESVGSYNPKHKPHDFTPNEMIDIITGMDNPSYILYQKGNDRYVEVVRFYGEKRKHATWAVIDFDEKGKNPDQMNGFNGGEYNVLVTAFDPKNLQEYINNPDNVIIYDKSKDEVSRGSGRLWPSRAELSPFNDKLSQDEQDVKRSLPAERVAQPAAEDANGDVLTESLPGDTQTKYSLSSWTDKEVKAVRRNLLKNGFTEEQADKWINDVNSVAAVIAADKDRLDFTPDRDQKFKKPNGDVYKWTLDASTLCAKRLLYQGTFNEIQRMLPNTPLRPGDLIELANMMHEMGYQTPCGICYVESRRRHLGNFTEEFLESYEGEYKPTYAELTSTDGLAKLKQEHRQAYDDYIAAMNGKGVASPKVVQLRTDYRGDVRDLNKNSIAYLNSIGGLRIQSFSDFETPHLLDMMQAVMDMSAKGLTAQAYTKVPNFAWVFGDTGIKINLSLMGEGTGVDENGNLVFSNTEGMDFDEAMRLRERYSSNVGTILVGMNDEHIIAAMADPRIDYIIPFHKSGWSQEELSKMKALENYTDYQNTQNELWITGQNEDGTYTTKSIDKKTGNLDPYGEDGYWDYSKSGQENAEAYLELCAKQKRLPKFSQFLVDNGDGTFSLPQGDDARSTAIREGYWKTLIDFKMYDNEGNGAPQEAVMPNINMDEAYRVLNEYEAPEGGNNALPKAEPVAERFVEWYKANHPETVETDSRSYSLPSDDLLEQQIRDFLKNGGSLSASQQNRNANPLEGMNPDMSTNQGTEQRAFGRGMLQDSNEVDQQVKDYISRHNSYSPDTNRDQVERAVKWIRGNKRSANSDGFNESLQAVTADNFDYRSADGQARMMAVMSMAVVKDDAMAQAMLADAYNRQGTDLGRALQARKLFRMMTPQGRIESLDQMLRNYNDELSRKGVSANLTFSQMVYDMAAQAQTEEEFQAAQKRAAKELADQTPANWKDKIRSLRMLSMLANPRTHIRNIVGNALFIPAVGLKNKVGALMELGMDKGNRTKTLAPFLSKDARAFAREDAKTLKGLLTGEAKFNETTAIQKEQKAFKGLLQGVIDLNGNALEAEDWIFLKGHYRRALGGWMMANGYTSADLKNNAALLEQGRAYAVQEAQKATYRDFNQLASTLNSVSRKGGVAGFLTDAILPFKKTPANILRRGIEYSPVGIMRSLTTDLYHLKQYNDYKDGKFSVMPDKAISPNQFIDHLCSGLSGTMIMAVGALLSRLGIVSCGLDDDEDEFEKAKGNQKYSFRFSIGGQDFTYTMDWAAPMSMPFFVGAAIQQQMEKETNFDIEDLIDAFGNITEPVFNLSMLDGVNTLFKTSQYDDTNTLTQIGGKILSNYATSYVPSLFGAIARTIDDKQRKAYVESGKGTGITGTFRYAWEQTQNKIPGWGMNDNIPVRDIWGKEKTSTLAERIIENFISPGYIENYRNDPIIDEMARLWDATGDKALVPDADPDKTITYKKQKYVLTAEQWDKYKETRGKTAHTMLTQLIDSEGYKTASDEAQAEMIKNVWDYADQVGKQAVIPDYEIDTKEDPLAKATKKGKTTVYESDMLDALERGDYEGFDTMVEALREEGVKDTQIKEKISNKYRDPYKEAYRKYMETGEERYLMQMEEIAETLDIVSETTEFDFDIGSWEIKVDEKYGW